MAHRTYASLGLALLVFLAGVALPASGADVEGVHFDERVRLEPTPGELTLNGAGVRTKLAIKVYAIALYLPEKTAQSEQILASLSAKRVTISILMKQVTAAQFMDSLRDKLESDLNPDELRALQKSIMQIDEIVAAVRTLKRGQVITLDYLPGLGTRVLIDNEMKGSYIPGETFYRALLTGWIGPRPVSRPLKLALLGQA
jgi:hypothetical protein